MQNQIDQTSTDSEWESIDPGTWKAVNDGDSIEGRLLAKEKEVGPNNSNMYHLETPEGQIGVWGSTVLDSRMKYVSEGDYIKITFQGTSPNAKGQDTKMFAIQRKKE